jgi:hypothetical protein
VERGLPELLVSNPSALNDSDSDEEEDEEADRVPPDKMIVSGITTYHSTVASLKTSNQGCPAELDSHADTCSFGKSAYIVQETGETISVAGFIDTLGTVKEVPIVAAAVAYDDPATYQTYILFFHQALYFEKLDKHLLSPAQMRANQVIVNEVPLLHLPFDLRTQDAHSIIITTPPTPTLHIPLSLHGTTSYFETRKPTREEITSELDCIHIHMTSDQKWDPYDASMGSTEATLRASLDLLPRER